MHDRNYEVLHYGTFSIPPFSSLLAVIIISLCLGYKSSSVATSMVCIYMRRILSFDLKRAGVHINYESGLILKCVWF